MGNFIPHLSHHTEPLRQLLKKDVTFSLGRPTYTVLSGNQAPFKEADIEAAWILRSAERSDCPGGCFSKGTGRLSHTGWQTNSLCQQVTDRSGEPLCQHRKRTSRRRLCMHTIQHVSSRAQVHAVQSDHKPLEMIPSEEACTTRLHVFRECSYSYRDMT